MSATVKIVKDLVEIELLGKLNGQPIDLIAGDIKVVVSGTLKVEIPETLEE
jgi:hypothetical protein